MSGGFNPYSLGGWGAFGAPAGQHPASSQYASFPSVYGALPGSSQFANQSSSSAGIDTETSLSFQFTGLNPDIVNCIVMGPNARYCFSISTSTSGYQSPVTSVRNEKDAVVARIEWANRPIVEIEGVVPRVMASQLIPLSRDQAYRTMTIRGRQYAWAPAPQSAGAPPGSRCIQLFHTGTNPAQPLGMFNRHADGLSLDLAPEAMRHGALEVCVVIGLLLYSGRNFD